MVDILNWFIDVLASLVEGVLSILPNSPFSWDVSGLSPVMAIANYFVPFAALFTVLGTYVISVAAWYAVRWILRIGKYIS